MNKLLQKLRDLLQDRYGIDQLSVALVLLGCLITLILSFASVRYYRLFGLAPMLLALLRVLSKKPDKRRAENDRFLRVWDPIRQKIAVRVQHAKDKDHRYYTCPTCKKTLRVPKNRGKIEITCPHCGRKFKKRT